MISDIVAARQKVVDNLFDHGFKPRDADPTDFQVEDDRTLRFKVGTVTNEITVLVYQDDRRRKQPLRATSMEQVVEMNHDIDKFIHRWRNGKQDVPNSQEWIG